ncbi:YfcE family phosphodiesterase [Brevibacillus choshinensis]|uniref:Phosphoesterase n=1 Tax=Brevibacillus choshinensis TaxID=54911 RepID=A0ABX7FSZ9_BRECH|nr:metallophosphoesterase [Brevibacillus choshinensis]QRG69363.1 metallophosphoesterase [Brevibacillus choshinensis]
MGILVISDTHGLVREVQRVTDRHAVEKMLHCGDFCVDHNRDPFSRMTLVRGNCDTANEVPTEQETKWRDLHILQTHGHLYGVKSTLLRLHYRAEETGANVVIFGHSHVPACGVVRDILFLNPGSLQLPRGFEVPTYAIIEQTGVTQSTVLLSVSYYDHHGNPVRSLGGNYSVRR